tara:strand:- start:838 stop:1521 length:684 start_codon:yes stop_codon:yes gene_type:complete
MTYIVPNKSIYYIHIPKSGGSTEYHKLEDYDEFQVVPEGKHAFYDSKYEEYDTIYTHVRNPHNRLLSMYLFQYELQFMPDKFVSQARFLYTRKILRERSDMRTDHTIKKLLLNGYPEPIDKWIGEKARPFISNPSPDNYCKWLLLIRKLVNENIREHKYPLHALKFRPFVLQSQWLSDQVTIKKIEDETERENITTKLPGHEDQPYLDAAKDLIEEIYKEDFNDFGY